MSCALLSASGKKKSDDWFLSCLNPTVEGLVAHGRLTLVAHRVTARPRPSGSRPLRPDRCLDPSRSPEFAEQRGRTATGNGLRETKARAYCDSGAPGAPHCSHLRLKGWWRETPSCRETRNGRY